MRRLRYVSRFARPSSRPAILTLASMAKLTLTYSNQGRLEEAEKLEVQVLETFKTKVGADHPDTLTSMSNLASKGTRT